jgi:hypothetical protein
MLMTRTVEKNRKILFTLMLVSERLAVELLPPAK